MFFKANHNGRDGKCLHERDYVARAGDTMQMGTGALCAFLERMNASKTFGAKDLALLGKHLHGPIAHPFQLSSMKMGEKPRWLRVGPSGLWVVRLDEQVIMVIRPNGTSYNLPPVGDDPKDERVLVQEEYNGQLIVSRYTVSKKANFRRNVLTVHMYCGERIVEGAANPSAAARGKELLFAGKSRGGLKLVSRQEGRRDKNLGRIPLTAAGRELYRITYTDRAIVCQVSGPIIFDINYLLDENPKRWRQAEAQNCMIERGVPHAFKVCSSNEPYRRPNPWIGYNKFKVGDVNYASSSGHDGLSHWHVTRPDPTGKLDDYNSGFNGPGFSILSNLFEVNGQFRYYGWVNGHLYLMHLGL